MSAPQPRRDPAGRLQRSTTLDRCFPATAESGAAAAFATQLLWQQVTTPLIAGLREWRRSLRLPTAPDAGDQTASLILRVPRNSERASERRIVVAAGVSDPWTLATAPWLAAATAHGQALARRVWTAVPDIAVVVRRREPEEGTPLGDLQVIAGATGHTDGRRQLAALERTVDRIAWQPRNPAVRRALAARAANVGEVALVKRQELRAAVYLVLAERRRPQAHRFGRSWTTAEDGRLADVVPEQMEEGLYWRWFCDEARKAAEASLLGEPYPATTPQPPSARGAEDHELSDPSPGPLELLLAEEVQLERRRVWGEALDTASPRQRQLLAALVAGNGVDGRPAASLADAARRLGMAPSTARVQWKRLVDRLRGPVGEPSDL